MRSSARAGDGRSSGTSRAIALAGIRLGRASTRRGVRAAGDGRVPSPGRPGRSAISADTKRPPNRVRVDAPGHRGFRPAASVGAPFVITLRFFLPPPADDGRDQTDAPAQNSHPVGCFVCWECPVSHRQAGPMAVRVRQDLSNAACHKWPHARSEECHETDHHPASLGHRVRRAAISANPPGPPGFSSGGFANAETHYAGSQPQNSRNTHSVSQYDVAAFQVIPSGP